MAGLGGRGAAAVKWICAGGMEWDEIGRDECFFFEENYVLCTRLRRLLRRCFWAWKVRDGD